MQRCLNCGKVVENNSIIILCAECKTKNKVSVETIKVNPSAIMKEELSKIKVGSRVRLNNEDHVWHNKEAELIDKKHKFVKLFFADLKDNQNLWVPNEWVKEL